MKRIAHSGLLRLLVARFEEYAAGVLIAVLTLVVCAQLALTRTAAEWASPLSTLCLGLFFWATMLGIPAATRRGAHLSLVFLSRRLRPRWRRRLRVVWLAAALVFFGVLAVTGTVECLRLARLGNRFEGSQCPDWVVTVGVPFAAALSFVRAVEAWWASRKGETPSGEE